MTSLVYDLDIVCFANGAATYRCVEPGIRAAIVLAIDLPEDELVSEFGQVPAQIRVAVREPDGTGPADEWLDTSRR